MRLSIQLSKMQARAAVLTLCPLTLLSPRHSPFATQPMPAARAAAAAVVAVVAARAAAAAAAARVAARARANARAAARAHRSASGSPTPLLLSTHGSDRMCNIYICSALSVAPQLASPCLVGLARKALGRRSTLCKRGGEEEGCPCRSEPSGRPTHGQSPRPQLRVLRLSIPRRCRPPNPFDPLTHSTIRHPETFGIRLSRSLRLSPFGRRSGLASSGVATTTGGANSREQRSGNDGADIGSLPLALAHWVAASGA